MTPRNPRALVVEDEPGVAWALMRILEHRGWSVVVASDAEAALAVLPGPFDLAVLDLWLPVGSGLDVLRAVRAAGLDCRVVVSTGKGPGGMLDEAVGLAPDALFPKPVDHREFVAFVDAAYADTLARLAAALGEGEGAP